MRKLTLDLTATADNRHLPSSNSHHVDGYRKIVLAYLTGKISPRRLAESFTPFDILYNPPHP